KALDQGLPLSFGLKLREALAVQLADRLHNYSIKITRRLRRHSGEARANQAHGERMACGDSNVIGIVANQVSQANTNFGGRMTVVSQHKNTTWVLAADADKVGNAVHKNTCLPRAWSSKDQNTRLFTIISDDVLLNGVLQRLHDRFP